MSIPWHEFWFQLLTIPLISGLIVGLPLSIGPNLIEKWLRKKRT